MLQQKITNGAITAETEGIPFSLSIIRTKPELLLSLQNQRPVLLVKLNCVCDLSEYTYLPDGTQAQTLQDIADTAKQTLQSRCAAFLERILNQDGLDLFLLHNRFVKQEPSFAKTSLSADDSETQGAQWQSFLQTAAIQYDIELEIHRVGQNVIHS